MVVGEGLLRITRGMVDPADIAEGGGHVPAGVWRRPQGRERVVLGSPKGDSGIAIRRGRL